ncbi:FHA domain-containing protein [Bacillus sp. Bva_UNVM-123]|uniref:FHA domain-containing protein n=1 Tax=Bacillus sp. Bva_UNVM-123 TaxID=2829798 RepID=UPI00391F4F64
MHCFFKSRSSFIVKLFIAFLSVILFFHYSNVTNAETKSIDKGNIIDNDLNLFLWIFELSGIGALLLLFISISLIIVIKKKKANKNSSISEEATVYHYPNPILIGLSGYFIGQTIQIDRNYVNIGRDVLQCQLVFPTSNEEISRRHCTIHFNTISKTFAIEDFSVNGTFLQTGERIPQGKVVQLHARDRFYLGSKENMFEVNWEKK